jgi:putative ABC transport system permease protein
VSQQTREFGIRLALGAHRGEVIRLVLRRGLRQVSLGFAVGLPFCLALAPVLSSVLVGLPPLDPIAFLGVFLLLGRMAALAGYVPACRAARVEPMEALRCE